MATSTTAPNLLDQERKRIRQEFHEYTNMSPTELETWLDTEESESVGAKTGSSGESGESTGHASGRRIVLLKRRKVESLTADDYAHMRKVINYVKRHTAQRPSGDVRNTRWRYSLMNWGFDPLKEERK